MILDTLSTNFINFINYTYTFFVVMFITIAIFLSYPLLREPYEDEKRNKKEEMVFSIGFIISCLITLVYVLVMIVTLIYVMFQGVNLIDFIKIVFKIISQTSNGIDENEYIIALIILIFVNFLIIIGISGLITRFWGDKIYLKLNK